MAVATKLSDRSNYRTFIKVSPLASPHVFIVDAVDPNNSSTSVSLANSIGTFDQVTQEYDAGTYYLNVEGDSWDITIENYQ